MPSVTSNICFMCLSEKTENNKFQLKLVQDEMLKRTTFVLPELPISRQMCPQYICNICYKRILYFYKFKKMCNRNYTRWMYYMTKLGEKTNLKQMQEMKIIVYKSGPPPEESENAETTSSEEDSDVEITQLRNNLNPQNSELNKNTTQEVSIVNTADSSSINVQSMPENTDQNDAQHPNNIGTANSAEIPEIPEKPAIQILHCTICNKPFYTQMALQYHLNLIHNKKNVQEYPTSIENSIEKSINPEHSETSNKLISLLKMSTEENTQRKALDIVKICEKIKKEIITSKIENPEDQENSRSTSELENNATDFKIENVRSLREMSQSTPKSTRNEEKNTSSDEDWTPKQWIAPSQSGSKRSTLRPTTSKNYQERDEVEEEKPVLKRRGRPRKKPDVQINISKGKLINNILDNYIKTGLRPDPEYLSDENSTEKMNIVQTENEKSENKITFENTKLELNSDENSTKNNSNIKRRPGRPKIIKLSTGSEGIIDNKLTKNDEKSTSEGNANIQKTEKEKNTNESDDNISNIAQKKNIHVHSIQTFASPDKNASNDVQNKFEKSPDALKNIASTSSQMKSEETAIKVTENISTDVITATSTNKMAAEDDKDKNKKQSTRKLSIDDDTNTSTNKMAAEIDEKNKKPFRLKNKRKLISTSSEDSDDSIESLTITNKMAAELEEKNKNTSFDSPEIKPKRLSQKRKLSISSETSIASNKNDGDREVVNKMAAETLGDKNVATKTDLDIIKNQDMPSSDLRGLAKPPEISKNVQKKARPKSKQKNSSNTENKLESEKLNIQSKARPKSKQKKIETNLEIKDVQSTSKPKVIKTIKIRTCEICDETFSGKQMLGNHLKSKHLVEVKLSDSEEEIMSSDDEKKSANISDEINNDLKKEKHTYKPRPKSKRKHLKNDDMNKIVTPDDNKDDDNSADELLNNIQELIDETSNKSPENTSKLRDRKLHMRKKDDIPKRYQCNVCKKKFTYASSLTVHLKKVHLKLKKPCPICQKELTDTYSILLHIQKCHNEVEVNFAISEKSDKSDDTNDSGDDFGGEPPGDLEKNPHVEKMLNMKLELAKQKKMLMVEARKKVDDFVCKICNKICLNKLALVSHIKSHKIILKV